MARSALLTVELASHQLAHLLLVARQLGQRLSAGVAAGHLPLVLPLGEHCPTRWIAASRLGKLPTTSVRCLISLFTRSSVCSTGSGSARAGSPGRPGRPPRRRPADRPPAGRA